MREYQDIYSFAETQETSFETEEIQVGENWYWNFRRHVQMLFHLKNGVFFTGANDWMRQFKNLMEGILELSAWTEDIEVKDVTFFIEGDDDRALTFLVKKYHDEVYVREHDLDKLFDEITESDLLYGGVLVQKGAKRPEVVQLNRVAFCDQTQFKGGPRAVKLNFSPSQLKAMKKRGWGEERNGATMSLEDLCYLASYEKDAPGAIGTKSNNTPGKTIEVYIVRGDMPESWLKDGGDEETYISQVQIIALYTDEKENKVGVTLYRKEEEDGDKFFSSSDVEGRALGRGVGEKLLPDQVWWNWKNIHRNNLLEAASKVPLVTDDPNWTQKNKIQDMENLEVTVIEEGKKVLPVTTAMLANIQVFEKAMAEDFQHAQFVGQAFDSLMGKEESAGTTFRGQERLVAQGRGPHERRRGQRAKFIEELYRWDILPRMIREITKGKKFIATLSVEEMAWVADQMATKAVNKRIKEMVLNLREGQQPPTKEEQMMMMQVFKESFFKKGNKHLLEIVKDELEGVADRIGINIAGKQKNLSGLSDRILSIVETAMVNPQFRASIEANGMTKAFNDILEYGGLSPVDFNAVMNTQPTLSPMQMGEVEQPKMMMQENGRA